MNLRGRAVRRTALPMNVPARRRLQGRSLCVQAGAVTPLYGAGRAGGVLQMVKKSFQAGVEQRHITRNSAASLLAGGDIPGQKRRRVYRPPCASLRRGGPSRYARSNPAHSL